MEEEIGQQNLSKIVLKGSIYGMISLFIFRLDGRNSAK